MKILILSAHYHPFIHPRAHRWTALAEHWAAEGHSVQVLTARVEGAGPLESRNGVQVHRVGFDSLKEWVYYWLGSRQKRGRVGQKPSPQGRLARMAAWVYQSVWKAIYFPDDACIWYFPAKRKLMQLLEKERFDLLITVSLPFTGHLLGLSARAKQKPGVFPFWMADMGDPFSFQAKAPNNTWLYGAKNRRLEQQILETADAVTLTTEATLRKFQEVFGPKAIAKARVIPPLFAASFPKAEAPIRANANSLKIGYFGAFYAPTRTPDGFLALLDQVFAQNPALRERLDIHFYGEIFPEFLPQLSARADIHLHGLCSRETAWAAMQEMDILLHIGNTTDFQLPSKSVDYLAAGKPVFHLSYVENDPFEAFFRAAVADTKDGTLFTLKISEGKINSLDLQAWISWLGAEKPVPTPQEIQALIAPFCLENIAKQYLLGLKTS